MRVVSVTPARLDRDSRTLKTATSLARLGHESIVVEGVRSVQPPRDAPFALVTVRSVGEALADGEGATPAVGRGAVERIAAVLGRAAGPLYFAASFVAANVLAARNLPAADLYWLHGYEQSLAVWLRRTPYVYDAHDYYPALPHDGRRLTLNERATHRVRRALEGLCVRRAAARVTTSETMARMYTASFGRPFTVLHNAQDARLAQDTEADVRSAAAAPEDAFLLAMVGNNKPGTVLPQGLPEGVHAAIVGARYDGLEPPERVHLTGPVAPEHVASFLRTADAAALFYVPVTENSRAQLVNGLFHAVSAGLPLLYPAGMEAIAELCERHGLGVPFDPGDPAALAPALERLRAQADTLRAAVATARPELEWAREERAVAAIAEGAV